MQISIFAKAVFFLTLYAISDLSIKNHILKGNILVNNDKTSPSYILKGNENISYDFSITVKTNKLIPQDINFDIIYEDEYLVIINKPSGLVVHPGSGIKDGTLANGLIYKFKNLVTLFFNIKNFF